MGVNAHTSVDVLVPVRKFDGPATIVEVRSRIDDIVNAGIHRASDDGITVGIELLRRQMGVRIDEGQYVALPHGQWMIPWDIPLRAPFFRRTFSGVRSSFKPSKLRK